MNTVIEIREEKMGLKFANLNFEGYVANSDSKNVNINIGDFIEFIAIDQLYESMGIDLNNVVTIDFYHMDSYDGEEVILPINFRLMIDSPQWNIVNWSPKIIPVFIGVSLVSTKINDKCKCLLKKYEPIGCRDEATHNLMQQMGIQSYIGGCISLTIEKIFNDGEIKDKHKIFFIDVPEKAKGNIPQSFRGSVEILHHEFYQNKSLWEDISCKEYTRNRLLQYQNEAKLIVTSRFHGTISALSLGIPVIPILENYHDKFEIIEKIAKVYDVNNLENIEWNPEKINYEVIKKKIRDVARKHICFKYQNYGCQLDMPADLRQEQEELTDFFRTEKSKEEVNQSLLFHEDAIAFIKDNWKKDDKRRVAFWGYSETAGKIIEYLKNNYTQIEITEIYDTFKAGKNVKIGEIQYQIKEPTIDELTKDNFIFVASNSASKFAESIFRDMAKEDYFLCRLNFIKEF